MAVFKPVPVSGLQTMRCGSCEKWGRNGMEGQPRHSSGWDGAGNIWAHYPGFPEFISTSEQEDHAANLPPPPSQGAGTAFPVPLAPPRARCFISLTVVNEHHFVSLQYHKLKVNYTKRMP